MIEELPRRTAGVTPPNPAQVDNAYRRRSVRVLPGQYFDSETGKHYNYFRDYDPSIGRYNESDPLGLKAGINTYSYVKADPLKSRDLFGLRDAPWEPDPPGQRPDFLLPPLGSGPDCPPRRASPGEILGGGMGGLGGLGFVLGGATGLGIGLAEATHFGAIGGLVVADATAGGAIAGGVIGAAVGAVGALGYLGYLHYFPPDISPPPKGCPCP
jgi:RHS repeat-associated protein